jgi:hypothetical protein
MFAYMFSHEAHHRGQILMLAHQLSYRVLNKTPGIWQWRSFGNKLALPRARAEGNPPSWLFVAPSSRRRCFFLGQPRTLSCRLRRPSCGLVYL